MPSSDPGKRKSKQRKTFRPAILQGGFFYKNTPAPRKGLLNENNDRGEELLFDDDNDHDDDSLEEGGFFS